MKLATDRCLAFMLTMRGFIPLLPTYAFVALCLITWHHVPKDSRQKLKFQKVDLVLVS
jgi:uncharacterized membrane protein (GlpM family)